MKKVAITKKYSRQKCDNSMNNIVEQQELFHKVTRTLTTSNLRPSQHNKIITVIDEQIKRPETSKNLKKDYRSLMDLVDSNKKVLQSRYRSILSYKQMKSINQQKSKQKFYQPLFMQIKNTQDNRSKRKYKKYDLEKFQQYLENKQIKQQSLQAFVQNTLFQGMRDIKNYIPLQAKLHKKLSILGELLIEQKQKHIQEIKKIIMKQKEKTPEVVNNKNMQIYLVNQYLLEKLMMKIYSDSSALLLKKRNSQVYQQIKNQMVGQIIHENQFSQMLDMMDNRHASTMAPKHERSTISARNTTCNIYSMANNLNQSKANESRQIRCRFQKKSRLKQMVSGAKKHQKYGAETDSVNGKNNELQLIYQFQKIYSDVYRKVNQKQLQLSFWTGNKNSNVHSMMHLEQKINQQIFS